MNSTGNQYRADWYPDPTGRFEYRYHNGAGWTADVSHDGVRYVDPMPPAPGASGPLRPAADGHEHHRDGLATAAMILGIVGLCLAWVPVLFVVGAVCALLAVVLGAVARRRTPRDTRGFAGAGILMGAAAILLVGVGVWTTTRVFDVIDDYDNPPASRVLITRCAVDGSTLHVEGTIENVGDRASEYRVIVRIRTGAASSRKAVFDVDRVEPGEVAEFADRVGIGASLAAQEVGDPTCRVDDVTGPLPFGLDIEG